MDEKWKTKLDESKKKYEKEINLRKIFNIIMRRIWIVLLFIIIFTSAGLIYSFKFTEPIYESSARVILQEADVQMINTLSVIIKDSAILDKVINELDLNKTSEDLATQISVQSNAQVVTISVIGYDPLLTAKIANSVIHVFKDETGGILGYTGVKILSEAKLDNYSAPINQSHVKTILIAFALGLVAGTGLVLFLNSVDDSVRSENELEEILGIPVLGSVSKIKKRTKRKKKSNQSLSLGGEPFGSN